MSLNAFGVGSRDEVIIPALSVAMYGFAVWQCGATPVYADVLLDTFEIILIFVTNNYLILTHMEINTILKFCLSKFLCSEKRSCEIHIK